MRFLKSRRAKVLAAALLGAAVIGGGVLFVGGSASAEGSMNVSFRHDETGANFQVDGVPIYSDTTVNYARGSTVGLGTSRYETGYDGQTYCFQQWLFESTKQNGSVVTVGVYGQYGNSWWGGDPNWNQATLTVPDDWQTTAFAVTADYAAC